MSRDNSMTIQETYPSSKQQFEYHYHNLNLFNSDLKKKKINTKKLLYLSVSNLREG